MGRAVQARLNRRPCALVIDRIRERRTSFSCCALHYLGEGSSKVSLSADALYTSEMAAAAAATAYRCRVLYSFWQAYVSTSNSPTRGWQTLSYSHQAVAVAGAAAAAVSPDRCSRRRSGGRRRLASSHTARDSGLVHPLSLWKHVSRTSACRAAAGLVESAGQLCQSGQMGDGNGAVVEDGELG